MLNKYLMDNTDNTDIIILYSIILDYNNINIF